MHGLNVMCSKNDQSGRHNTYIRSGIDLVAIINALHSATEIETDEANNSKQKLERVPR